MGGTDSGGGSGGSGGNGGNGGNGGASAGTGGRLCSTGAPVELSEVAGTSVGPRAQWNGNGYGVVWSDNRDGNSEIYFARLDAAGRKVGNDVRVTNALGESAAPVLIWAVTEFGVVWHDQRDGNTEIYFVRLDPAGNKLGVEKRVTTDSARSEFPSLAPDTGGFAVAWNDTRDGPFQIYVARLDGEGTKRGQDIRVSSSAALAASPSLAAGPSGFGVAWHDLRDGAGLQIYFAGLDATGARIGNDFRLSALASGGGTPSVASAGSGYAVAWASGGGSGGEIYWVSVGSDLVIDGNPITLSSSGNTAGFPVLVARQGAYAIAWPDGRDEDQEIYVQELDAAGNKVGAEVRVSDDATASLEATLTRSSNGYGVAWTNDPTQTTGEVRFTRVCP
jgi:hypothetical protein